MLVTIYIYSVYVHVYYCITTSDHYDSYKYTLMEFKRVFTGQVAMTYDDEIIAMNYTYVENMT